VKARNAVLCNNSVTEPVQPAVPIEVPRGGAARFRGFTLSLQKHVDRGSGVLTHHGNTQAVDTTRFAGDDGDVTVGQYRPCENAETRSVQLGSEQAKRPLRRSSGSSRTRSRCGVYVGRPPCPGRRSLEGEGALRFAPTVRAASIGLIERPGCHSGARGLTRRRLSASRRAAGTHSSQSALKVSV
jgi:hypothetical protein